MTIRELAQALGLSKTTVAYALNDMPRVSAATRELVQRRARELGYIANPVASGFLRQVRSQGAKRYRANLAFIDPMKIQYSYVGRIISGAVDRARDLGYGLDVLRAGSYESAKLTQILSARGVLGVIIGPLAKSTGHITLDWSKFASVAYGYTMARPVIPRIGPYHLHGIRTAFRMCRQKGFRRVGLALTTESNQRSDRLWSAGFLDIQQTLPESERVRPLLVPNAVFTTETMRTWMLQEKPDAVILHNTNEIYRFQSNAVNRQVVYVVLDRLAADPYAGIDQQFQLCGGLLVDMVSSQVLHNQRGIPSTPTTSLVDGVWVDHPSFTLLD